MWRPSHPVLSCVSTGYPRPGGGLPTCYSPVRRSRIATAARLACLKRAASVRSEPGSNSPSSESRSEDRGSSLQVLPSTPHPPGCQRTLISLRSNLELTGSPHSFRISSFLRYRCKELFVPAFRRASLKLPQRHLIVNRFNEKTNQKNHLQHYSFPAKEIDRKTTPKKKQEEQINEKTSPKT